ncbi:ATP-binding protein [Petroclostridium sp. X23]|uniref:ATP-binding response regulator n=1 Tax=Petroclostridium sp. X23 TaxID=3045146 RepID=UPI0024AD1E08|nr:ATP-binding protein [Petroclostridium sp. X23]WHH61349.1 ATP-binding protein [Petroclostridium sp. X23]
MITNQVKAITKDNSMDHYFYMDKMSALNNQLINAQRELYKKNDELEKANDLKNQYLGMVVHDLRNPLAAILTYSQSLISDIGEFSLEKQLEFLGYIRTSTESMLKMVDELLDISKIEAGKLDLKLENVNLGKLVQRNVTINNPLAQNKKIDLSLYVQEGLPDTAVDIYKIEQVLNNLISNAIKFSKPGGSVEVQVYSERENIVIAVIDQGEGIPENEIGMLFQPFSTTSVKSTYGEKNTGLGLAIARKIVEGHNGRIEVQSKAGEGSRFFAYLPIVNRTNDLEDKSDHEIKQCLDVPKEPLKILIVEDDIVSITAVEELFRGSGCIIKKAGCGKEALKIINSAEMDLVLLDIEMSGMNGMTVCKHIREWDRERRKHTYIAGLSAHPAEQYKARCIEAGMDHYIRKPLNRQLINETMNRLVVLKANSEESCVEAAAAAKSSFNKEIFFAFFSEYPGRKKSLEKAIKDMNFSEIRNICHVLKGGLTYLGLKSAIEIADEMEKGAEDSVSIKELFNKLIYEIEKIRKSFVKLKE